MKDPAGIPVQEKGRFLRRLFPQVATWTGKRTYRIYWGGQWFCYSPLSKSWYIKLEMFGHRWQYSNMQFLINGHLSNSPGLTAIQEMLWCLFFMISFLFIGFVALDCIIL